MVWGILGLIGLSVTLMLAIRLYKKNIDSNNKNEDDQHAAVICLDPRIFL